MAATEASAAPVVQEDGKAVETKAVETKAVETKAVETKATEAEQTVANANSETVNSEVVNNDAPVVNSDNKETVKNDAADNDTAAEDAAPQGSESSSSAEPKTSFLDSFLNKSGLGKVMAGRKKKEHSTAGAEENATEEGEKEGEKGGEEAAEGGAEGGAEGEGAIEKAPENGEKEEEKKEKPKQAEAKSSVRDLIRKPVARIFSHRSTEKKDGAEPPKQVQVRSKSLDRLEDPEALNATADSSVEEGAAAEGEQKASSSTATTKHMKRWHSFKKLMAQKTHKKSSGEEGKEEGAEGEGGGDSSTLDSKESGQKRWKLKRSWTFQGLKRDPSVVGISSKTKSSDKDEKTEEGAGGADGGEEVKAEGGEEEKTDGGEEKEKAEGGEEEKGAAGGTVTQHANEIWTSFKKRVIPKSKRANTECAPSGEEDTTAATSGEDGGAEEGKVKAKRSHFGRAVSLKNFILRKGKSTSVDHGDGAAKEEEEDGEAGGEGAATDGEVPAATEETNDKPAEEATANDTPAEEKEAEKTASDKTEAPPAAAPVTNGNENGCSNGTTEENATHNHQEEEQEKTTGSSPMKKELGKEEANAKIISATAVNSDDNFNEKGAIRARETSRKKKRREAREATQRGLAHGPLGVAEHGALSPAP